MARAREKYEKLFNANPTEHPDYDFVTSSGLKVQLRWQKNEYRAFKRAKGREWEQLFLGSTNPEPLMEYIKKNF